MTLPLNGKTALVTGGSRGIGRAVVCRLAEAGARVVFTYRREQAAADDVVTRFPGTVAVRTDQADLSTVDAMVEPVRDGLDILVNNAAISTVTPIADLTTAEIEHVLTVNFTFPLLAIRAAIPLLRDHGRIINISSLNTVVHAPGLAMYCATKGALEQITAVAARELGPRGITVNSVLPGTTDTDMFRAANPPETHERLTGFTALQRIGTPEEVAGVVAFLAGPESGWVTGQNIRATGGLLL